MQAINGFYSDLKTQQLNVGPGKAASKNPTKNADYAMLASQISVSKLHKETKELFSDVVTELYKADRPTISEQFYNTIQKNAERLNSAIEYDRDFDYDYFSLKTLEKSYLLRINGKIVERPQHMLMRIAVGIHGEDIDNAIETYNLLSKKYFIHDSSTLFAIGRPQAQLSSCFLSAMTEDSLIGIYDTLSRCASISRFAGEIGINVQCIRAKGSTIASSGGVSTGLVPMLRVYNATARLADHGGRRPGAFAIYVEPWHADIFEFLNIRKNSVHEEERCRDLSLGLWIPDLFMKRVEADGMWSLMCPHKSPNLYTIWGDEFEARYTKYESDGQFVRQVKARDLWFQIIDLQIKTGTPYMLYKDTCNRKTNQQNLGTIRGSNFSTESILYTDHDEVAVCNQASIAVNMFVKADKTYDFDMLKEITKVVTRNLNKINDINCYPIPECKTSNLRHRPIGIGIQGLADAFILMRLPYDSEEAGKLNQQIFETIYYGALEASCELAQSDGRYETYEGSPVSKGILQYDMWNKTPTDLWDWDALKQKIAAHGIRNSLLLGAMPTTSTAQILGNSESFEPYTSNFSNHRVLSNNVQLVNQHLIKDLIAIGMWNDEMKNEIIANNGSIQNINRIPLDIRDLYKTIWEIPIKTMMNMAADRGAFIDQSQSFNIYIADPIYAKMSSMHFYAWKLGLKTGMYNISTNPIENLVMNDIANESMHDTVSPTTDVEQNMAAMVCSIENKDDCMMCGA